MMDYKHYYKTDKIIGTGDVVFRHFTATPPAVGGKSRLVQFLEGTLTELTPEDFGNITVLTDFALYTTKYTNLEKITMPDSITTIGTSTENTVFNACVDKDLTIIFPKNITKFLGGFGPLVFNKNDAGIYYDFSKAQQIPSIPTDTNMFTNPKKIIVPSNLYDSWITASGWKDLAVLDHITTE